MQIVVLSEEEDKWRWRLDENGIFTVKSVYMLLGTVFPSELVFNEQQLRVLNNIWKSPVPSKVIAFAESFAESDSNKG
jgi:O-methyltransferase involved in polyketide biosynthesis